MRDSMRVHMREKQCSEQEWEKKREKISETEQTKENREST